MNGLWILFGLWSLADWARYAAGFLLCLAALNLLALGAPTGAWRVIGVTIDEAERGALTCAVLLMWAIGAAFAWLLGTALGISWALALAAVLVSLAALLISLRFRLRLNRPYAKSFKRIWAALWPRVVGYLLYGVLAGILAYAREPMAFFGYAVGQFMLSMMCLGVEEPQTQANRRSSWLLLSVELTTLLCVWLFPLSPATFRFGIALPIYAMGLALTLSGQARRLPMLLVPMLSGFLVLLPTPYPGILASTMFALFVVLMRRSLYEAVLPVRAYWIRNRASRR